MNKTLFLFSCLFFLVCGSGKAQFYNQRPEFLKANGIWAFGFRAGLDLSDGTPRAIRTSAYLPEGAASASSPVTGELQFYVGTRTCYNRNGDTMPNGRNLVPNNSSTSQGIAIVPMVDSPDKYYVFLLNYIYNYDSASVLTYSVVDMTLDGGLGDIEPGRKNIPLDVTSKLSEAMTAVPGNNCDVWLLVHTTIYPDVPGDTSNTGFKAFHITRDGIDPDPVYSSTKEIPANGGQIYGFRQGCMAVSPNREMIAIASHGPNNYLNRGTLLCKFDPETGSVSDGIWVDNQSTYGVCFSPDNTKLYTTTPTYGSRTINQFEISNYDSAAIASSLYQFAAPFRYHSLKLYNDTIYVAVSNTTRIDRINNPNNAGATCGYDSAAITLISGTTGQQALPNDVVYAFPPDTTYSLLIDTLVCTNNGFFEVTLEAVSGYSGYEWNDGLTDSQRVITEPGTYWVIGKDECHSRLDTFTIKGSDIVAVITVNEFELSTTETYSTYQWFLNGELIPGATDKVYHVTENGDYTVWVSDGVCNDTSDIYEVTNVPTNTNVTNLNAIAQQIKVYPNPVQDILHITSPIPMDIALASIDGRIIKQEENATTLILKELPQGVYFLQIRNKSGALIKVEKLVKN